MPNRRLLCVAAAAEYLGKAIGTILKLADLNIIKGRVELGTIGRRRRVFALQTATLWSHRMIHPTAKNPDPERRRCMGIYKVKDHRGMRRYVVSKYWPNGSGRLRRYAPNYRSAQALQTRGGVQHPARHLGAAQAETRRWEPQDLEGPEFLRTFSRGVLQNSNALLAPLRALVQEPQCHAGKHSPEGIPAQGPPPLRRETEGTGPTRHGGTRYCGRPQAAFLQREGDSQFLAPGRRASLRRRHRRPGGSPCGIPWNRDCCGSGC